LLLLAVDVDEEYITREILELPADLAHSLNEPQEWAIMRELR
jgi:hypothetical protein